MFTRLEFGSFKSQALDRASGFRVQGFRAGVVVPRHGLASLAVFTGRFLLRYPKPHMQVIEGSESEFPMQPYYTVVPHASSNHADFWSPQKAQTMR